MTLSYQLFTLYILLHLYVYIIVFNICFCCFESLDLPQLPADRSDFDVHGALNDDKVQKKIAIFCKKNEKESCRLVLDYTHYTFYTHYL